jgi:hypothetical protein
VSGCSSRSSKSIAFAAFSAGAMAAYTSADTWASRSNCETPAASSDGGIIRFLALEMSACTARGGNTFVECPR